MKHEKPLAVRIFIRLCVWAMVVSLIWGYLAYMFVPSEEAWEDIGALDNTWDAQDLIDDLWVITWDVEIIDEILPEVNPDEPEDSEAPILVREEWEIDEMDQTFEVQLNSGETEIVRQWDLWDSIQIDQ